MRQSKKISNHEKTLTHIKSKNNTILGTPQIGDIASWQNACLAYTEPQFDFPAPHKPGVGHTPALGSRGRIRSSRSSFAM